MRELKTNPCTFLILGHIEKTRTFFQYAVTEAISHDCCFATLAEGTPQTTLAKMLSPKSSSGLEIFLYL